MPAGPSYEYFVSVTAPDAETHDRITTVKGSFDKTMQGLEHLDAYPHVALLTNTVVTSQSYRGVPGIVERLGHLKRMVQHEFWVYWPMAERDEKELAAWKNRDPLARLGNYLRKKKLWDDKKEAVLQEKAKAEVAAVVERAEHIAAPKASDFFDSMYADLPEHLIKQRETMQTHSLGQDPSQLDGAETPRQQHIEA